MLYISNLAALWNYLKNFTEHLCLGPAPQGSAGSGLGCSLAIQRFKSFQVILICSQVCKNHWSTSVRPIAGFPENFREGGEAALNLDSLKSQLLLKSEHNYFLV